MISIPLPVTMNCHDYDAQIILIRIEFSLDSRTIVWHVKTFNWYWRKKRLILMLHGWIQESDRGIKYIFEFIRISIWICLLKVSVEQDLNSPFITGIIIWCCLRIVEVLPGVGVTGWRGMYGLLVGRVVVVVVLDVDVIYAVVRQEL